MNFIDVRGGTKFQKEVAFKVVSQMISELMPRMRTLEISVRIRKFSDDAIGYCMMEDTNRQFEIEVSKDLSLKDFVTALCHEMVHAKQYARNEMSDDVKNRRWKKTTVPNSVGYWDLPWEKEAYRMEDKLAQIVWEKNIL